MTLPDVFIRRPTNIQDLGDDELMTLVCSGDHRAFRALYDRYRSQIFIYCLRMLNDRDGAKDVLQEIFIRVHSYCDSYRVGTNFVGWLHTIARNLCLNARRDAHDHTSFDESAHYNRAVEPREPDVALREHLAAEIARLPDIYRDVLILREYEEHSYQEIADIMGIAMSAVKFRIFKAREILRERLAWSLDELRDRD